MYNFRPASDRILEMRQKVRDRVHRIDTSLLLLFTEGDKKYANMVPILRKALTSLYVAENVTPVIEDFDVLVGSRSKYFCGNSVDPRVMGIGLGLDEVRAGEWTLQDDGLYHTGPNEEIQMCIAPEDVEILEQYRPYWDEWHKQDPVMNTIPDGFEEFKALNCSQYGEMGYGLGAAGHLIAGYPKIINQGYDKIRKVADDWITNHMGNMMGEDANKYCFYKAASIMCRAATELCLRFAEAVEKKKETVSDPARIEELAELEDALRWISRNPARNFLEAVQATLMYQTFLNFFELYPSQALGRIDQYTWPFLKKDLEEGTITIERAQEIIDSFFLRLNAFYGGGKGRIMVTTGIGNTYQHTTIGGVDPDTGEDATNPVTFMVLETVGRLKLHDPTISLRINKNSPDELWDCALATSKLVGGLPLFQNDEVIVPAIMEEMGWDIHDARDYGIIGCQEIVGCGNDYPAGNGMPAPHDAILHSICLSMAINDGKNPFNGEQAPIHTGYLYDMNSIEEVHEAYRKITEYAFKWTVTMNNFTEQFLPYFWPQPGLSISMDGCMESGKDIVAGGAKHNSYGGTATGLATVADSFTTIKYMCFDKKYCTTRELYDAVMANWEGYEPLRQRILNEVPHFGNADPYADMEMKYCIDTYVEQCRTMYSARTNKYKPGLYGAADHIAQGYHTWATPDGRKTGDPIADAASPAQGRDKNGPMAVFQSELVFDHHPFMDGMALNIRMHPSVMSNQLSVDKLRDVTKFYFEQGGLEVQYNVVDTETLKAAQADPNAYRDLVVRIAGYSAYFIELSNDMQNDIISRNENMI